MKNNSVLILIEKNDKNEPFAKVYYNGLDVFDLDEKAKLLAINIKKRIFSIIVKSYDGIIFIDEYNNIVNKTKYDELTKINCFISGCKSDKNTILKLVDIISFGASSRMISVPVFVTDGKEEPVFINEEQISKSYQKIDFNIRNKKELEKAKIISKMISNPSISYIRKI